jgi:hypothetical protein
VTPEGDTWASLSLLKPPSSSSWHRRAYGDRGDISA